mgnify:CR=1 FL=1
MKTLLYNFGDQHNILIRIENIVCYIDLIFFVRILIRTEAGAEPLCNPELDHVFFYRKG